MTLSPALEAIWTPTNTGALSLLILQPLRPAPDLPGDCQPDDLGLLRRLQVSGSNQLVHKQLPA